MSRTALLAAIAHIRRATRDEDGNLADRDAVERDVDGILCADDDWEQDDGADLFEAAQPRKEGETFKGPSGRWFTIKKGRVVPAKAPQGGNTPAGGNAPSPDVPPGGSPGSPSATYNPKASPRPNKTTRLTPEQAEQQIAAFQQKANVQPSDLKDLANTLADMLESGLTKEHLQAIARKHASKLTGKKQQLASALAQTALAAIKSGEASKPTDAATTHLQAFQAVKQGQGDAKKFMAGVRKLKVADVKALAAKIGNQKVPTKALGLKVISEAIGGGTSGEEKPQGEQPKAEPKQGQPAEPATPSSDVATRTPVPPADIARVWSQVGRGGHNQVSLADLQDALKVSPEQLHATVNALRKKGILFAEPIEGGRGGHSRELAAAIREDGQTLGYVGVRPEKAEEFKRLVGGGNPSAPDVPKPSAPSAPSKPADWQNQPMTTSKDSVARLQNSHGGYAKSLPDQQKKAIHAYTGGGEYESLNKKLRSGGKLAANQQALANHLDAAVDNAPPLKQPETVYRGMKFGKPADAEKLLEQFRNAAQTGGSVQIDGYQSTSARPEVALEFATRWNLSAVCLTIRATKGMYIPQELSQREEDENELLLPRGGKYRVAGMRETKSEGHPVQVIELEQL